MENEIVIYIFSYRIKRLSKFKLTHMYNNIQIKLKLVLFSFKYHAIKI